MANSMVFILVLVDAVTSTLLESLVDGDGEGEGEGEEADESLSSLNAIPMPIANPIVVTKNTHTRIL